MKKISQDYTFEINRPRIRLGLLLMYLVLLPLLTYTLVSGLSWGTRFEDRAILALIFIPVCLASVAAVRSHYISLRTVVSEEGVFHEHGALQGLSGPRRLIPWDAVTKVIVSKGLLGYPDFTIVTAAGNRVVIRGFYYQHPNLLWAAFKRHVRVIDES